MRIQMLGIPIDAVTRLNAIEMARGLLNTPGQHLITTPNPEMLVDASRDTAFAVALKSADLALADGIGLVIVSRLLGRAIPSRISGTDFVDDLAELAARVGKTVFLLGGEGERVAERTAEILKQRHPGLKIAGALSGVRVFWEDAQTPRIEGDALVKLKAAAPDILLVAFGHRKQELWIQKNLVSLPSVRLAMGIGGAFDFIAGDVRRAPSVMRKLGLEWLWRLIIQPWRVKRIWKAVVTFPWLAFKARR
jgi:N-acetylglucosaminyldiphosphoundecaprenol N-acetyl-beta-D-mannosaminyltransferase